MGIHDLVVGVMSGKHPAEASVWANSLDATGYDGTRILLVHKSDVFPESLNSRSWFVRTIDEPVARIHSDRFKWVADLLDNLPDPFRYVVFTDVTDVVFQKDPTEGLDEIMSESKILIGGEGIRLRDEEWGRDTTIKAFGNKSFEVIKNQESLNCGVIVGDGLILSPFFRAIHSVAESVKSVRIADQAATNLLAGVDDRFKHRIKYSHWADGYVAHLGCHPRAIPKYSDLLVAPYPVLLPDGTVETGDGRAFSIVHQYNRIVGLREPIWKKYWESYDSKN